MIRYIKVSCERRCGQIKYRKVKLGFQFRKNRTMMRSLNAA